jgi:hypothetical protein
LLEAHGEIEDAQVHVGGVPDPGLEWLDLHDRGDLGVRVRATKELSVDKDGGHLIAALTGEAGEFQEGRAQARQAPERNLVGLPLVRPLGDLVKGGEGKRHDPRGPPV